MSREVTDEELVQELAASVCRCGGRKFRGQSFCRTCWYQLSTKQRTAMYLPVGEGYREAYEWAVETLTKKAAAL